MKAMLNRQRILLSLIQNAHQPLNRISLVKYAFLLSKEHELPKDCSFYEFVPHSYGAFSFALARELQVMERYGYITSDDKSVWVIPDMRPEVARQVEKAPRDLRLLADKIMTNYGAMDQSKLLRMVYAAYPRFTFRSKLRELIPPAAVAPAKASLGIYTIGYEGRSVDGFFDRILQTGLRKVIDVRANPVSRKYGFAKSTLSLISKKLGLEYMHMPELGISSQQRKGLGTTLKHETLLDDYEYRMLPNRVETKRLATASITSEPSVLVCMEENPFNCHRSRLARAIASESGLAVHHL
jgi:uncharacterized protein (DUF488 family)